MSAVAKILPDWPRMMSRDTAEAYLDGPAVLRFLEERGLRPAVAAAKMTRFDRREIDMEVTRLTLERGPSFSLPEAAAGR